MVSSRRTLAWAGVDSVGSSFLLHHHRHSLWYRLFSYCRVCIFSVRPDHYGERKRRRMHVRAECDLGDIRRIVALAERRDFGNPFLLHDHRHSVRNRLLSYREGELRSARQKGRHHLIRRWLKTATARE